MLFYYAIKWHICGQDNLLTSILEWHGQVNWTNKLPTMVMKLNATERYLYEYQIYSAKLWEDENTTQDDIRQEKYNTSVSQWNQMLHRHSKLVLTKKAFKEVWYWQNLLLCTII